MLSDTKIRKAAPADRDYKLADEKGLFLLVRKNGGKLWRMKYRVAGKEKLLSFGPYPDVTLTAARDARDVARRLLREGVDPGAEKKRVANVEKLAEAHTFEAVAREWHELQKGRWSDHHQLIVIRSLERDVFPTLGKTPIGGLDAHDILDLLRKIEKRGSIETAKRIRQRISGVFLLAISKRIARDNPAKDLNAALLPKPKARKQPAVVDLTELRDLLRKAEDSGASPVTLLASRLLALTAVRPGVVRGARWDEFHGIFEGTNENAEEPYWHVPAERMKLTLDRKDEQAFDHIVPLAPEAVDVLRAANRLTGRGELVFPGQRHAHIPLSENAIGYLYNRVGWHGRHVPHGWRAAFSTIMNERAKLAGIADDRAVIDLMLAHVPENKVESAYNRAEFMPRRREIACEWAKLLLDKMQPADELLTLARRKSDA
ncbi:tyrosine-type recombinase/integrase [Novosphingobium sp.]|uniref:tyrosine-type recombinase/integrase n=1 Tax=Novosphingobium sp. TaxID=1874826 RepID=UPI003561FE07